MYSISAEPVAAGPDPTAYYNDFWLYASYYGEAAARVYYTEWSPPIGTLPPPGTILPGNANASVIQPAVPAEKVQVKQSVDPGIAAAYEEYRLEVNCFHDFTINIA